MSKQPRRLARRVAPALAAAAIAALLLVAVGGGSDTNDPDSPIAREEIPGNVTGPSLPNDEVDDRGDETPPRPDDVDEGTAGSTDRKDEPGTETTPEPESPERDGQPSPEPSDDAAGIAPDDEGSDQDPDGAGPDGVDPDGADDADDEAAAPDPRGRSPEPGPADPDVRPTAPPTPSERPSPTNPPTPTDRPSPTDPPTPDPNPDLEGVAVGLTPFGDGDRPLWPARGYQPAASVHRTAEVTNPNRRPVRVEVAFACTADGTADSCDADSSAGQQYRDLKARICFAGQCDQGFLDDLAATLTVAPSATRDITIDLWLHDTGAAQEQGVTSPFLLTITTFSA